VAEYGDNLSAGQQLCIARALLRMHMRQSRIIMLQLAMDESTATVRKFLVISSELELEFQN